MGIRLPDFLRRPWRADQEKTGEGFVVISEGKSPLLSALPGQLYVDILLIARFLGIAFDNKTGWVRNDH